ncbi:hypothetical protein [Sorangium sp. So ce861]|uniref:hypothetical protein n=1 Tax=Sorangium sp. So ce861 TaxID=3133323 RepID=UPI003F5FDB36
MIYERSWACGQSSGYPRLRFGSFVDDALRPGTTRCTDVDDALHDLKAAILSHASIRTRLAASCVHCADGCGGCRSWTRLAPPR